MASDWRYALTQRAADDLDDIVRYMTEELCNPSAAANFVTSLQGAIEDICIFPESCAKVTNEFLSERSIRKKFIQNYTMYYFPDAETQRVVILRIVYARRDANEILRELER
jgi:plasmid stabilization system protein ParE